MKRALLMGINYPGSTCELHGCINDVKNIKALLMSNGYQESNIVVLTDDNPEMMPTLVNILREFERIATLASAEIFVHYSGHGSNVIDKNNDEISGFDSVIVPCDFLTEGVILDDVLFQIVSKIRCKATLLFDSCNSGSVCDLPYSLSFNNNRIYQSTTKRIARMENKSVYMISGCRDSQFSADLEISGEFCGAFTNAFLKSIEPNKSIIAVYVDTCRKLPPTQVPVLSMSAPVVKAFPSILTRASPPARNVSLAQNITGKRSLI